MSAERNRGGILATVTCHCAKPIGECDCIEARVHAAEMTASFNLRWDADMRAIKRWQAAGPDRELTWPDHADLVVWLMEQLAALAPEPAALRCRHCGGGPVVSLWQQRLIVLIAEGLW